MPHAGRPWYLRAILHSSLTTDLATGEKRDWGTGPMPVEIFAGRVSHFKNFKGVEIPGGHHVHLNAADTVAPHILSFIQGQAKL